MKTCSRCGEEKPLDDYYLSKNGRYSHLCKRCSNEKSREYHSANREKRKEQMASYRSENRESLYSKERERMQSAEHRNNRRQHVHSWRERNREHVRQYNQSLPIKARSFLNKHVAKGGFPPANTMVCDVCQESLANHYHHYQGYEKDNWLVVKAVCTECHGKEHRK